MTARRPAPPDRDRDRDRDRQRTSEELLRAVGRLLARKGFDGLGVNAIAREAGVDKVLIYRYFGGLPGLLAAFAEEGDHWPSPAEITTATSGSGPAELGEGLIRFARALRARPETQAILCWELSARNELVDAIAAIRERQGIALLANVHAGGVDVPALASVLSAGLTYLVLRGRTADAYNGIDLHSDEGWARFEDGVRALVSGLAVAPKKRSAKRAARATPAAATPKKRRARAAR